MLARDPWTNKGYEILEAQTLQGSSIAVARHFLEDAEDRRLGTT
jgi:hypothetical protein